MKTWAEEKRDVALVKRGLEARCPKHPTYRAIKKPQIKCDECELMYEWKHR